MKSFLALFCLLYGSVWLSAAENSLAYSYRTQNAGGVAAVTLDDKTGKILRHEVLFESEHAAHAKKVRRIDSLERYVLTNESAEKPYLFFFSAKADSNWRPRTMQLGSMPDEVCVAGTQALVTCDGDSLVGIDVENLRITKTLAVDQILTPPGNGPQGIMLTDDQQIAVVSFQKDSRSGSKKGSRLLFLKWPELNILADLQLPRDHVELHITGSEKDQGPGPELMFHSPEENVLAVSYDLYGAVALMDWDAAVQGKMENYQAISTSADGEWGTAFPDRGCRVRPFDRSLLWVANAGTEGGATVFDLESRQRIWQGRTPAGLERPVYIPSLRMILAVCAGKTKTRTSTEVVKQFSPQTGLYLFRFQRSSDESTNSAIQVQSGVFPSKDHLFQIATFGDADRPLVLLAAGPGEDAIYLRTLSPYSAEFLDEVPAKGKIQRFEK